MSDLIRREDAIERATKEHDFYRGASTPTDKARRDELLNVMCWLGELPSAEPKTVRCKDCKWYGDNWVSRMGKLCMNSRLKTGYGTLWVEDDFYCGYGEEYGVE